MAILKLPHWVLVNKFPAFHDLESATVLEQTSRLYGKINELIESYNGYCEEINKAISEYEAANDKDYNCFVNTVLKLTSDYIGMVDLKITQHDRKFDEYYKDFTENINKTIGKMLAELKESGELDQMVLESLDNMQTKFTELESKCNAAIEEMEQTAKDLAADYEETKTALDADYTETKSALDTDYTETKSALDADYSATKTELNLDYKTYKQNIGNTISAFTGDVSGLKTGYSELQEEVANLQTDASGLKTDVSGLKTDVSGLKTDVSGLKTDYITSNGSILCDTNQTTEDGSVYQVYVHYRKWKSGNVECWIHSTTIEIGTTGSASLSIALPSTLLNNNSKFFCQTQLISQSISQNMGNVQVAYDKTNSTYTNLIFYIYDSSGASSFSPGLEIYVTSLK